jgi:uncharacterized protein YjbI with pentapeptide repeats
MIDSLISKIDSINYHLTNFRENFYQGADFFKKKMSEGSFKGCDLRGCDFRRSKLSDIDFSDVRCGKSFVRTIMLVGCVLFSLYVAYNLSAISKHSIIQTSFEQQQEIIVNLMFKLSFLYSLAFSIYYNMAAFSLYNFFESKAVTHGMIIEKNLLNNFIKTIILPYSVYVQAFGVAISSTAILFLGTDSKIDIFRFSLYSTEDYQKQIAFYLICFQTLNLLFIALGSFLTKFLSTKILLTETSFEKSILEKSYFCNAVMNKVSFKGSDLVPISFKHASLKFVNFSNSSLEKVDFENADLTCCNFTSSNLVDLKEVNFKNAILDGAHYKKGDMINHVSSIPGLII